MNILATEFNTKSLLKYAMPTVLMMLFMSTYMIIDGVFVAQLVGEDALSAINIVLPIINVILAIGLMFATGGTAVMGRLMGEGKVEEARSFLSILYIVGIVLGGLLTSILLLFSNQIVRFLGANDTLFILAKSYLIILAFFAIAMFLQVFVQSFFVLAGKPMIGFGVCLLGGISNIVLDYILISPRLFNLGITGAGIATGIGNTIPAVFGILYFVLNKKGTLFFGEPKMNRKLLLQSMFNGMSELVSQLSTAVTTLLFNIILLKIAGNAGVASISVILYIQMIQTAIYFGYSIGVAPILSYKYGEKNHKQLQSVSRISFLFLAAISIGVIGFSLLLDDIAVGIFISPESSTYEMAKNGLRLFSIAYLFMGLNIFMSCLFTALSNGIVSAILSLSRTLLFLVTSLIFLPMILGVTGVWLAVPVAEGLSFLLALYFYRKNKSVYKY